MAEPSDFDDLLKSKAPEEVEPSQKHGFDLLNNVSDAQTIYADGCIFISKLGNAIRISLVETIVEPGNGPNPGVKTRHVANVVMPAEGYANMLNYMNSVVGYWAELEGQQGDDDQAVH